MNTAGWLVHREDNGSSCVLQGYGPSYSWDALTWSPPLWPPQILSTVLLLVGSFSRRLWASGVVLNNTDGWSMLPLLHNLAPRYAVAFLCWVQLRHHRPSPAGRWPTVLVTGTDARASSL